MIKCIIFDFDGVILESVDIKTEAFRRLFSAYPQHMDEIMRYHLTNGGISRFNKFRFIYKNILKEELTEARLNELGEHFSSLVVEGVIVSPFVSGAEGLLKSCRGLYSMFVVSGTPEQEMKRIVEGIGLNKYFKGVFGSPASKRQLIQAILAQNHYLPSEAVFIGDSINDLNACEQAGVPFIGRVKEGLDWAWDKKVPVAFKDMCGVYEYIKGIK